MVVHLEGRHGHLEDQKSPQASLGKFDSLRLRRSHSVRKEQVRMKPEAESAFSSCPLHMIFTCFFLKGFPRSTQANARATALNIVYILIPTSSHPRNSSFFVNCPKINESPVVPSCRPKHPGVWVQNCTCDWGEVLSSEPREIRFSSACRKTRKSQVEGACTLVN